MCSHSLQPSSHHLSAHTIPVKKACWLSGWLFTIVYKIHLKALRKGRLLATTLTRQTFVLFDVLKQLKKEKIGAGTFRLKASIESESASY